VKLLIRILAVVVVLVFTVAVLVYAYLHARKPRYDGFFLTNGLVDSTEVIFDAYGIPHIYAANEHDAYFALGFVHAQERLFQMEMLRRVASGRLAEVLGPELIEVDKFFRTLGIHQHSLASAERYLNDTAQSFAAASRAYTAGINAFIAQDRLPIEFRMAGIPATPFEPSDVYLATGFMAFSFAAAFRTDPLMSRIQTLGDAYLNDLYIQHREGSTTNPLHPPLMQQPEPTLTSINRILEKLPVAPWLGSNAWVIAPQKSATGKVMLANDTHIGYSQPAVMYEAHINYPGFNFFGFHLAGFPFAVIGRNDSVAWGLTMLKNDDMDFYRELIDSTNPLQYKTKEGNHTMTSRLETIKVKGQPDVDFYVYETSRGPLVNKVVKELAADTLQPISMFWTHTKEHSTLLQGTYQLSHAGNINQARNAVSQIASPGVNVLYGDEAGNVAWWSAAKLLKRPKHVNPLFILDGAAGNDQPLGYYDFSENPTSENPPNGYVYSANHQPDRLSDSTFYPGYYSSDDRAAQIVKFLDGKSYVTLEDMKQLHGEVVSDAAAASARLLSAVIGRAAFDNPSAVEALRTMRSWDGSHEVDDVAPTVYYKWLYHTLRLSMEDELGPDDFTMFLSTLVFKSSMPYFLNSDTSIWWDNAQTSNKESREEIVHEAFRLSIDELKEQLGADARRWYWGKVHTLTHAHPFARVAAMASLLNVGPAQAPGGMETVYNHNFPLTGSGLYPVSSGPALRLLVDFSNNDSSLAVIPTGQSGNFMSAHYNDQFLLHINCKYRAQYMSEALVRKRAASTLSLVLEKK